MATVASVAAAAITATSHHRHNHHISPRSNSSSIFGQTLGLHVSRLRLGPLPSLAGLKHLGISTTRLPSRECRRRGRRGMSIRASLFGVGAPEALVIGVVALLVFGPKGLAEVARNLGKTLRSFQPTIRELQEVSREFKSTLEREIGMDEIQSSLQNTYRPSNSVNEKPLSSTYQNGAQSTGTAYSSEDLLKVTEEQLAASAAGSPLKEENAQGATTTTTQSSSIPPSPTEAVPTVAAPSESPSSVDASQKDQ